MFSATNKSDGFTGEGKVKDYVCLAADTKPTSGIANGSMCLEMDTGKIYAFDETGSEWVEIDY